MDVDDQDQPAVGRGSDRDARTRVYRPERVMTNVEICEVLDSSDEWIQTRSGIRTRRYAGEAETLVEMATRAARGGARSVGGRRR